MYTVKGEGNQRKHQQSINAIEASRIKHIIRKNAYKSMFTITFATTESTWLAFIYQILRQVQPKSRKQTIGHMTCALIW